MNDHRVMFAANSCYSDSCNGASIATRSMMECLAQRGFSASAVTGTVLESDEEVDAPAWLTGQGIRLESFQRVSKSAQCYRILAKGVDVQLHASPTTRQHVAGESEIRDYLELFDGCLDEKRPDVVVTFGATRSR